MGTVYSCYVTCGQNLINIQLAKMNILNQQDVLEEEIKLLNTPGPTLSNFYTFDSQHPIFFEPQSSIKQSIERASKIGQLRTTANYPNSVFNILSYVLLNSILEEQSHRNLLDRLKCTLYSPSINLTKIIGFDYKQVRSNNQLKKILVEFLQILTYHTGDLETLLNHYPIVVSIFALMFRTILLSFHFKDAEFYNKQLNSFNTMTSILDFFDISYHIRNNIIVFESRSACVLMDDKTNRFYIGERIQDLSTKTSDLNFDLGDDDDEEEYNMHRKDQFNMPTPCFGQASWDDPLANKHSRNFAKDEFHQHYRQSLEKVEEEIHESGSAQKFEMPPEVVHYDFEHNNASNKLKCFLQSIPNSPTNQTPIEKNGGFPKKSTFPKQGNTKSTIGYNPEKMKCSQIQQFYQSEQFEKKSSKSENVGKRKTEQNEDTGKQDKNDRKYSNYAPDLKINKLQSCVVQLKIEPEEKKVKNVPFDDTKSVRKFEPKNFPNYQAKTNVNKSFNKIPQFLIQKQAGRASNSPINSPNATARKNEQRIKKPRVTFTYTTSNIKKNTTFSEFGGIDTSRINYVSQSITPVGSATKNESSGINRTPFFYPTNYQARPSQWQYFGS